MISLCSSQCESPETSPPPNRQPTLGFWQLSDIPPRGPWQWCSDPEAVLTFKIKRFPPPWGMKFRGSCHKRCQWGWGLHFDIRNLQMSESLYYFVVFSKFSRCNMLKLMLFVTFPNVSTLNKDRIELNWIELNPLGLHTGGTLVIHIDWCIMSLDRTYFDTRYSY